MLSFTKGLEKYPTISSEMDHRALLLTFGMRIPNKPLKTEFHLLFRKDRLYIPLKSES
jgi:hypothetical protein